MDATRRLWPRSDLRVGDVDRQGVVVELQRHFVDGRLTTDELEERVTQALNARTFADLALPLSDLPVLASAAAVEPEPDAPHDESKFAPAFGALLVTLGMLALMWMLIFPMLHVGGMHWGGMPFWPIFVLGFFFIGRRRRGSRRSRWHREGPPPTQYL